VDEMDRSLDKLHYLFIEKPDRTVAHCLDLDLVAVADTTSAAEKRLNILVSEQIMRAYSCGDFDALFFHAPKELWEQKDHAKELPRKSLKLETKPPRVLPVEQRLLKLELMVERYAA
jgi:hypothetical protein